MTLIDVLSLCGLGGSQAVPNRLVEYHLEYPALAGPSDHWEGGAFVATLGFRPPVYLH